MGWRYPAGWRTTEHFNGGGELLGLEIPSGSSGVKLYPCMRVLPMGWSWSVYFCQRCHDNVLLSTLRGTPPQHLFDVDLLWNDLASFEFFMASVACVAFSVSAGVSRSPFWELWGSILGAKIVHFGSQGGPWHL